MSLPGLDVVDIVSSLARGAAVSFDGASSHGSFVSRDSSLDVCF